MTARSDRAGLGNPPNGNAPRPPGACRILMIGDVIGKPGRVAVEQVLPGLRDERGIDFVTANGENLAGGMGLTISHRRGAVRRRRGRDHERQPHLGQARDLPVPRPERPGPASAQLRHARRPGPRLGHLRGARRVGAGGGQPPGPDHMQPIDNPFTDADRLLDEASEPLPPIRLVDFHCELTSEKNAMGLYLDGRVSAVVGHPHPRRHRRRADPAQGHGLPDRPRDDRAAVERHRLQARHGAAAVHQRAADAVRGRGRAR